MVVMSIGKYPTDKMLEFSEICILFISYSKDISENMVYPFRNSQQKGEEGGEPDKDFSLLYLQWCYFSGYSRFFKKKDNYFRNINNLKISYYHHFKGKILGVS